MIKLISARTIFKKINFMNSFSTYLACIHKIEIAIIEVISAIRLHFSILKLKIISKMKISINFISSLNKLKKRRINSSLLNLISGRIYWDQFMLNSLNKWMLNRCLWPKIMSRFDKMINFYLFQAKAFSRKISLFSRAY